MIFISDSSEVEWDTIANVVMWRAIRDIFDSKLFFNGTTLAHLALRTATMVMEWMSHHSIETQQFASRIEQLLENCFRQRDPSTSKTRAVIWSCPTISQLFIQFVGHSMFKTLIKAHYHQNNAAREANTLQDLTHIQYNAIRGMQQAMCQEH